MILPDYHEYKKDKRIPRIVFVKQEYSGFSKAIEYNINVLYINNINYNLQMRLGKQVFI